MIGTGLSRRSLLAGFAVASVAAGRAGAVLMPAGQTKGADEPAIEPELAIVDPHHHLREFRDPLDNRPRYLAADLTQDIIRSGHRVLETVFLECGLMFLPDGLPELRSLGETQYVRAVADRSDAGSGPHIAAGIVAKVDLRLGARAAAVLERHIEAGGGRVRGIRNSIAWDAYPPLANMGLDRTLLANPQFREGVAALEPLGLSFDVWLFHPQIAELTALARACPGTRIILNHCGNPLGIGPYAGRQKEVFAVWKQAMADLAEQPNVKVKLGGLGSFSGPPVAVPRTSSVLAEEWRPWIETCIDLFGPRRCMFESNYPADAASASYGTTWNAFKHITARYSAGEKDWLYRRTARDTYRLGA